MDNPHVIIMTVEEGAVHLRIPKSLLYKLALEGRAPAQKAGWQWRFHRETIDNWLLKGEITFTMNKDSIEG